MCVDVDRVLFAEYCAARVQRTARPEHKARDVYEFKATKLQEDTVMTRSCPVPCAPLVYAGTNKPGCLT